MRHPGKHVCRYCDAEVFAGLLTLIGDGGNAFCYGHEPWCRENIPATRRVEAYAKALIGLGASPQYVHAALSESDRQLLAGL